MRWRLDYGLPNSSLSQFHDYVVDDAMRSPIKRSSSHLLDRGDAHHRGLCSRPAYGTLMRQHSIASTDQ